MSPTLDGGGGRGNVLAALAPANPCSGTGGGSVPDSSAANLAPPWALAVVVATLCLVL